jgi:hypothetical protein
MITELTNDQKEQMAVYRDKWIAIGRSTNPANRGEAERGVRESYKIAGIKPPERIVWATSPLSMFLADSVRASVRASVGGQNEVHWLSFCEFFGGTCGINIAGLNGLICVAKNAGWWLPYENICFISERQNELHFDENDRLHNPTGQSIGFNDGFGCYHWHGVQVSEKVIMKPIEFDQIMEEQNAEIKRVMIERFGEKNFIKNIGAAPIDETEWGSLYRVDYGDDEPLVLVRVKCPSTSRIYFNQVPPLDDSGNNMVSAKQAIAWRFGMAENEYMPLEEA